MEESLEIIIERRKYIISAVIIFSCILAGLIYRTMTWEPKPDPESEAKIRQEVASRLQQKGLTIEPNDLTDEDFAKIDSLILGNPIVIIHKSPLFTRELSDIKILEKFSNLRTLELNYIRFPKNKIPKWMSLMAKLGFFSLEERFPLDLSPLEKLNNLEILVINDTAVKDFKTLGNLTNLKELTLGGGRVCNLDLSPLEKLNNLEILMIGDTVVKNLKTLENLTNLKELTFRGKTVSNIEPVKKLTKLKNLYIYDAQVTNLEPLSGLNNLQILYIYNTPVANIEALRVLNNLQELHICHTQVSNIEPLKGLENLQKLKLQESNNISDEQVEELQKALPTLNIIR